MSQLHAHRAHGIKFAIAYAGTLALVASVALFPSASSELALSSLRGLVAGQGSFGVETQAQQQALVHGTVRSLSSWIVLLTLLGACLVAALKHFAPVRTVGAPVSASALCLTNAAYGLPLVRGPSL